VIATFFDFDGTLAWLDVDIDAVRRDVAELFEPHGIRRDFSPLLATIDAAAKELGDGGTSVRSEALELVTAAELSVASQVRPREGAREALERAAKKGSVAIVTNNSRRAVRAALEAMSIDDVVVVGREDGAVKPSHALMVEARRALGTGAGLYRMIGDSPTDVLAARAARAFLGEVECIALTGGRCSEEALADVRPDRTISELDELWK